jgi:hypothetical protein
MIEQLSKQELETIVGNYSNGLIGQLTNETRSARIRLSELIDFVKRLEQKNADGVRIYFTRPDNLGDQISPIPNTNKQMSIAIVPTKNGGDTDYYDGRGKIDALVPRGEMSGLCPPLCFTR